MFIYYGVYVCTSVRMYFCECSRMWYCVCLFISLCVILHVILHVCMHMYASSMYACTYSVFVILHDCTYVYMCVRCVIAYTMYAYMYTGINLLITTSINVATIPKPPPLPSPPFVLKWQDLSCVSLSLSRFQSSGKHAWTQVCSVLQCVAVCCSARCVTVPLEWRTCIDTSILLSCLEWTSFVLSLSLSRLLAPSLPPLCHLSHQVPYLSYMHDVTPWVGGGGCPPYSCFLVWNRYVCVFINEYVYINEPILGFPLARASYKSTSSRPPPWQW